ncbi:MAG: hypothetical protein FJ087_05560 [Deltaproteobacteria bacterium]|nr:hypothetical protein [Deltaproteobacteria bacterium]
MRCADVLVVPLLLPAVLAAAAAEANDGANRYRPPVPPTLVHFPAPASPAAGYRLLAADGPDGSDGDPAFRWALPHAVAAVRLAAHETVVALGPAACAPAVIDLGSGPVPAGREALVEAEVGAGGNVGRATARVAVPPADPRLFVAVDPGRLAAEARQAANGAWSFKLRVPDPYRAYVTGVSWEVARAGGATDAVAGTGQAFAARAADGEGPRRIVLVRAVVALSGRMKVRVVAACPTT